MIRKCNRIGEENTNKQGCKMVIVRYGNSQDIDVLFTEYNWIFKNRTYSAFKSGSIKCPYEPRIEGVGYIGEGKYKSHENGKVTKCYSSWHSMLHRCNNKEFIENHPSYKECYIEDYWLNFQNFAEWYENNYYEVEGEIMCLDKDILFKGNKVYSRDTSIFVPQRINTLFTQRNNDRGNSLIGTFIIGNKFRVTSNDENGSQVNLGTFNTEEEAFQVYKKFKEQIFKKVIDSYEDKIPEPFYSRLKESIYNWHIEMDD